MGLAIEKLYATNIGWEDELFLSGYIPEKRNGEYYTPKNTPIGFDLIIPNVLDLTEEDGIVEVEVVKSDKETGLWLTCYNAYFGNEQHLYSTLKFKFNTGEERPFPLDLHISTNIEMKSGDGPIPVTLKRI